MPLPLSGVGGGVGAALAAYRASAQHGAPGGDVSTAENAAGSFGAALQRAVQGAVDSGRGADAASAQALSGQGSVSEVVMAVSRAELALQTAVAVRDRVVSAYQDVMRMPI